MFNITFLDFHLHHTAVPQRKSIKLLSKSILTNVCSGLTEFTLDTYTALHKVEMKPQSGIPTLTPSALKRSSLKCVNGVEELWSNAFHNS